MAEETVTEYETVEKTNTIKVCDNCGLSEEEKPIVQVAINPQGDVNKDSKWSVVEIHDDYDAAVKEVQKIKHERAMEGLDNNFGVGRKRIKRYDDLQASATADVCFNCVENLFDIDIPGGEDIESVDLDTGKMTINTTREVNPTIDPSYSFFNSRLLLSCIGWPFFFVMGFLFEDDYAEGYIQASLGAIVWFSGIITYLFLFA
jgi:hypothetical protein